MQNLFCTVAICGFALVVAPVAAQTNSTPQPGQLAEPAAQTEQAQKPNGIENLSKTISAPSFTVRDKFDYRIVQSFGARGLVGSLFGAAIGQAENSPHEWGQGVHGFAERYGSG